MFNARSSMRFLLLLPLGSFPLIMGNIESLLGLLALCVWFVVGFASNFYFCFRYCQTWRFYRYSPAIVGGACLWTGMILRFLFGPLLMS